MIRRVFQLFFMIAFMVCAGRAYAQTFPTKALELIVGFGEGGSTDRMARIMQPFLEEQLAHETLVSNIEGQGTQTSLEYFFSKPQDGHSILFSTFSPYIPNAIISGAKFSIDDFEFINLQWFDYDVVAVHQESKVETLIGLLEAIQNRKTPLKVALIYRSAGHFNLNLLLEKFQIDKKRLTYVFFENGQNARTALVNKKVDFLIISAKGSETVRKHIKPLAVIKEKRDKKWDAPTLNEAIASHNSTIPILRGSMRGIAVSKVFKERYPERYTFLVETVRKTLAQKKVQHALKMNNMGYTWIGPEQSNDLMRESFEIMRAYDYLFNP